MDVIVISKCIQDNKDNFFEFHFKGYFCGLKIDILILSPSNNVKREKYPIVGEEYILQLKSVKIKNHNLFGKIVRIKKISLLRKDFL